MGESGGQGRRRFHLVLGCILAVTALATDTTYAAEEQCKAGCKGASHTFKYAAGTTYKYDYDGTIEVSLSSAEGQSTSTEVKAQVLLTQQANCNQVLKLENVQVLDSKGKKQGSIPDIERPIRLNVNDGVIDDVICVEQGDNQNSINVKRAIASLFQASLKSSYETDVFGRCPNEISSHKEGNVLVIQKARNLNKCSYREHIQQDFLATAFDLNSEVKSSPILNGNYRAKLRIKNGILDQATVTENYLYVPFSVGDNGAKAQVTSKLQLTGQSKDSVKAACNKPRSIIFENPHPITAPSSNAKTVFDAVKKAAETVGDVVGENTAQEFVNVVKTVRTAKKVDILTAYNQIKTGAGLQNKETGKRLYLDAVLRAGNADAVEAVIELLTQNELDVVEQQLAYVGLSFVRHASEDSLNTAIKLLDAPKLPRVAYLGVGNLAAKFCRQHPCHDVPAVKALSDKLLSKVAAKANKREKENDIVYAIKAIGNLHHLNDNVIQKLANIAQDKSAANRIRVAALEAYLADGCKDKLRDSALQILMDIQQDSEIRIKAYLALAQCPNAKIGSAIKSLLEKEPSIQVGGFIASHIRNIRSSASPDKVLAKQYLGFVIPKRFPIDPRKWSFNSEFSYAVDTLGLAATTETNVIYSQNSWLPRSSSLNLTAEIFGHNFNFLEIETRQENLDKLFEHYLGPKGILRSSSLRNLVGRGKEQYEKIAEYLENKLKEESKRNKRDVSDAEIKDIAEKIKIRTNELNKDLDLDVSLKVLGSEVEFWNIYSTDKLTPEAIIDKIVDALNKGLDELKSFQHTIRSNLLFLDAEIDYPTSLGFPLRLAVEGTASTQIKAQGNINLRQLLRTPKGSSVKVKLIPSTNVQVSGRLTLDALTLENGLKVVSTLYSSSGADLSLSWPDQGSGFDLKLGLPVQEQKLISVNHEIVFHTREQSGAENNLPLKFTQVKDFSICLDQLSPFIGLTICAEVNGPNLGGQQIPILPFPLAGDAKIAVTVENDDVFEYHIKEIVKEPPTHADIILETIGKDQKRKVALELTAEYSPEKFLKAVFSSPIKSASAEARIVSTNVEKSILVRVTHDKDEFSGKLGVGISGTPERSAYRPILEYKTPDGSQPLPVNVEGQIIAETDGGNVKYIFDNVRLVTADKTVSVNGNIGKEGGAIFGDLTVSDGVNSAAFKGRLQATSEQFKFNVELQNSFNSNANFNLKGELKKLPNELDSSIRLVHGPDLSSKTNILTITNSFLKKYNSVDDFKIETKNKLTYPLFGVSGKLEFEQTPKSLDYDISVEYGDLKLGSELEANVNKKTKGDYEIEFEVWGLDNKLEIKSRRQVLSAEESKISHTLQLNDKKIEVDGKVRHVVRPQHIDIGAEVTLKLPTHSTPIKVSHGLKVNALELDAHQKITSGSDIIVDGFLKANKDGDANGSLKVNVKDVVTINGQVKSQKGVGSGDILVDLRGKRQIKADATFKIQLPNTFGLTANLYPSYGKDKNLKLSVITQTKLSETDLDTSNNLDFFGSKLEVNAKLSKTGDERTGKASGEIDVTLPSEQYFLSKFNCEHKAANDLLDGHTQGSLEYRKNKNSPGRKVSLKSNWRNTNPKEGILDVDGTLSADDSNGQNINADVSLKRLPKGDTLQIQFDTKIYGSMLKNPLESSFTGHVDKTSGNYETKASYGAANALDVKGRLDLGGGAKPLSGSFNLDLKSESNLVKSTKVELSGSLTKPENPANQVLVQGTANIFADTQALVAKVNSDLTIRASPKTGELKLNIGKSDPIAIEASYGVDDKNEELRGGVSVKYGDGKVVKIEGDLSRSADHRYKLRTVLQTPVEGYKNAELNVETKRSPDHKEINSLARLSVEGKEFKLTTDLVISDLAPVIDIKFLTPEGKRSEVYLKVNRVSEKQFGGEVKLLDETFKQLKLDADLDVNVGNIEHFVIKGHLHSPTLKVNKAAFEFKNKGAGKIEINIKQADKNYVSGSTDYRTRDENGKYIAEGSGTFKVGEETKSGNFKYIMQHLTPEKNSELGSEVSFDLVLGNRAVDADFKISNKQFRAQTSYCEEKKECASVEIDNKINVNDVENFDSVLEINLDLRKLGLSHEFGLKSETSRKGWIVDHTVDAHFENKENSKYQYSFYIHPKESGVTLTTPKRIVSLEGKFDYPHNIREGGRGEGEVAFFIDKKNNPNKKTALTWFVEVDPKGKIAGETKFTHQGLPKPLLASFVATRVGDPYNGKLEIVGELDVFAKADQKIVTTYTRQMEIDDARTKGTAKLHLNIKSQGLGINIDGSEILRGDKVGKVLTYESKLRYKVGKSDYDNVLSGKWAPNEISGQLKLWNVNLIKAVHKLRVKDQDHIVDSEVSSYRNDPLVSRLEVKNFNTLTYSLGFKKTPTKKLQLNAGLIPSQIADVRSDYLDGNTKTNLFHATVKLDDADFLKSDFNVESKEIEKVLARLKEIASTYAKEAESVVKQLGQSAAKELEQLKALTKKATPNLQPLKNFYVKELQEVKDEILNDKSIKELGEAVTKVLGTAISAASEIIEQISALVEKIAQTVQNAFVGVVDSIEKELLPQLEQIASRVAAAAKDILDLQLDIVLSVFTKLAQVIEQYKPELKELAATFGELGRDVGRFLQASLENLLETAKGLYRRIASEINASPVFDELKAQYQLFLKEGLPNADAIVNTVREVFITIKDVIPAEFIVRNEIVELLDTIVDYAEKKLKNQPVDDVAVLEKLGKAVANIVRKLASLVSAEGYELPGAKIEGSRLWPVNYFKNLPRLIAARLSPITFVLQHDISKEISDFLLSLVTSPRRLFAPFPLYGMVIQGQHIFTFDGKHLTFPGTCNYLLAGDAINNNFTVAAAYKNGLLASVTLADQKDSITLVKGGQVKLNNVATELPVRKPDIAAYRDYDIVTLRSTAGVVVACLSDLLGCEVSLSGFYHGQVKGLLGNGNNEPYDDFTLPNGKIVTSESEFGNAYKTKSGCANVAAPAHEHVPEDPKCAELFSWKSPMRYCYPFVSTENFKIACSHGLAAKVERTEEAIASAYVALCNQRNIPISLPEELVKCHNAEKPYGVGDTFSVKLPSQAADIVLLIDTKAENEELYKNLVQPLVQNLGKELHSKGIDDVEFHLITYGGENQWPSHVTVNGKLTFKGGKAPHIKFGQDPQSDEPLKLAGTSENVQKLSEALSEIFKDVELAAGLDLQARTYEEGINYPFRANAVKSIVAVVGNPCKVGRLYPLQKLRTALYRNNQISLNLFTPFETLTLKDNKKVKDIVGFNGENVFTVSQGKKSPRGSAELHKELNYEDFCVDFTLANRGNVFVNNNFLGNKADQKQFVHIAATNIVDQLINLEQGLDCECKMINGWNARNICTEAYSKERSTKKV
ncbi:apolipophorins [Cylas formicarius]|uniref:apolipophorins n=1 Tax=Cylas formicarius TaxID=197179 RepID=UPI002958BBF6|nr:apolipophorins [Cylas formicarius]